MTKGKPSTLTEDKTVTSLTNSAVTVEDDTLQPINRTFLASLFEQIFNSKSEALSLYNAINGTSYSDESEMTVTTLGGAVYLGYRNDVSFIIGSVLNLYEHQSTFNPNMPVRGLLYFARLYESYITKTGLDIYSSARLTLPETQYYVFYNGTAEQPDRQILKLSDSYPNNTGHDIHLEVCAVMLNINYGHNKVLMEKCRTLHDYALFVAKVREYIDEGYKREKAVEKAVNECIENNILKEFLIRNKAGVITMLFSEYAWQFHLKKLQDESREKGLAEGRAQGHAEGHAEGLTDGISAAVLDLLSDLGDIPEDIKAFIQSEKDPDILKQWNKLAARCKTIQEFINQIHE